MTSTRLSADEPPTILILDTDCRHGLMLRASLGSLGYQVRSPADHESAERYIEDDALAAAIVSISSEDLLNSSIVDVLLDRQVPVLLLFTCGGQTLVHTSAAAVIRPGRPSVETMLALIRGIMMTRLRS